MNEDVLVTRQDTILSIRLNRPDKKNALSAPMYAAIADAIGAGDTEPDIRAILFTAEGDIFSAGNDLADFAAAVADTSDEALHHVERFLRALVMAEKPLIAAVAGDGVGVGATMLLHCDIVVIAEDAKLITPFTRLGLTPEAGSSLLLPARIGQARAFAMLALGQPLKGQDAARFGLVTEAVPRADVELRARQFAESCCALPPEAMLITKRLMRDRKDILERIEKEGVHFRERLRSPEAQAAFSAFFKR